MTNTTRKVTQNGDKRPVVSNLRLPDDHYQPGDVASVTVEGATVTIKPKSRIQELSDLISKAGMRAFIDKRYFDDAGVQLAEPRTDIDQDGNPVSKETP